MVWCGHGLLEELHCPLTNMTINNTEKSAEWIMKILSCVPSLPSLLDNCV